jgi:hypothetical protein
MPAASVDEYSDRIIGGNGVFMTGEFPEKRRDFIPEKRLQSFRDRFVGVRPIIVCAVCPSRFRHAVFTFAAGGRKDRFRT